MRHARHVDTDEIRSRAVIVRADTLTGAIELVNRNRTEIAPPSSRAQRRRPAVRGADRSRMVGINVPIPVPMAFFSFGGWKQSMFGDLHMYGSRRPLRDESGTTRWPNEESDQPDSMPTLS